MQYFISPQRPLTTGAWLEIFIGENSNQVSTFKYLILLVLEASSIKRAFIWRFFLNSSV